MQHTHKYSNNKYYVDSMTAVYLRQNMRTTLHILYVLLLTTRKSYQQHHNCYEIRQSNLHRVLWKKCTDYTLCTINTDDNNSPNSLHKLLRLSHSFSLELVHQKRPHKISQILSIPSSLSALGITSPPPLQTSAMTFTMEFVLAIY